MRFALCLALLPSLLGAQRGAPATSVVTIGYTDWAFEAPATLPAGFTTFRAINHGKELHHASLLRLEEGKTLKDFQDALQKKSVPGWAVPVGGLQNSGQVTVALEPGTYLWWCFMPGPDGVPHYAKGMYRSMQVTKVQNHAPAPVADLTVTMRDYGWAVSTPLTPGHHVLKVINDPGQAHEFMLIQLAPGKSSNDFLAWLDKQSGPRPFLSIQGIPSLQMGYTDYVTVDLKPGRYSVISFNPDATDGKPQFIHGMVREMVLQ